MGKRGQLSIHIYTTDNREFLFRYKKYTKKSNLWEPERRELKASIFSVFFKLEWKKILR